MAWSRCGGVSVFLFPRGQELNNQSREHIDISITEGKEKKSTLPKIIMSPLLCASLIVIICVARIPFVLFAAGQDSRPPPAAVRSLNILQGNDDGWAEGNIRTLHHVLKQRGYQTVISAPVRDKSGTGSLSKERFDALTKPGEYDLVPAGAPGTGHDPADPQIWYVNGFPVDGIRFGLDTLAPQIFHGKPELIITGPNVGKNTGLQDRFSGTLGAAAFGAKHGVPAIAVSVDDGTRHSYQDRRADDFGEIYANATVRVVEELLMKGSDEYLPAGCVLNINLQRAGPATSCKTPQDYRFVLSSIFGFNHASGFTNCGSHRLPAENQVLHTSPGCWASVSLIQADHLLDASPSQKQALLDRTPHFFSCPDQEAGKTLNEPSIFGEGIQFIKIGHH
ncbi:hypothetical protein VP01_806g2 [Puccinia sorghi]|uniref:Survival protein SurE-like phosphatase/nucleotidase domain-containing protein n=1 Tax=Puccinia sorghi TaxID=27349 RepID=A0A0L6UAB7_9BASI|nr:hypothetical protein VP01_806g2 [Puccinia sorghi]